MAIFGPCYPLPLSHTHTPRCLTASSIVLGGTYGEGGWGREGEKKSKHYYCFPKILPGGRITASSCLYLPSFPPLYPRASKKKYLLKSALKKSKVAGGERVLCCWVLFRKSIMPSPLFWCRSESSHVQFCFVFFGSRGGKLGNGNLFVWYTHTSFWNTKSTLFHEEKKNRKPPPTIIIKTRSQRHLFYHTVIFLKKIINFAIQLCVFPLYSFRRLCFSHKIMTFLVHPVTSREKQMIFSRSPTQPVTSEERKTRAR